MPTIYCPNCNEHYEVTKKDLGRQVECGNCKTVFTARFCLKCKCPVENNELFCCKCGAKLPPVSSSAISSELYHLGQIYCKHCGTQLKYDADYCPQCGKRWSDLELARKRLFLYGILLSMFLVSLFVAFTQGVAINKYSMFLPALAGAYYIKSMPNKELRNKFAKSVFKLIAFYVVFFSIPLLLDLWRDMERNGISPSNR